MDHPFGCDDTVRDRAGPDAPDPHHGSRRYPPRRAGDGLSKPQGIMVFYRMEQNQLLTILLVVYYYYQIMLQKTLINYKCQKIQM